MGRLLEEKYNGYNSWATWNVALWIKKEEPGHKLMRAGMPYSAETARDLCLAVYPDGTPEMKSKVDYDHVNWEQIAEVFNEI